MRNLNEITHIAEGKISFMRSLSRVTHLPSHHTRQHRTETHLSPHCTRHHRTHESISRSICHRMPSSLRLYSSRCACRQGTHTRGLGTSLHTTHRHLDAHSSMAHATVGCATPSWAVSLRMARRGCHVVGHATESMSQSQIFHLVDGRVVVLVVAICG